MSLPSLLRASNSQGLGYTDEDSAGQQNIFAVEVSGTTLLCSMMSPA